MHRCTAAATRRASTMQSGMLDNAGTAMKGRSETENRVEGTTA